MSIVLVAVLIMALCTPVAVALAEPEPVDHITQAEVLKTLGLFLGSDSGFELERAATRVESAVMVVRLLGKEWVAKSENNEHPFTDVPEWAAFYVGYLYKNNITNGISADKFGSADISTAAQYATYVLRALGYDDSKGDFAWDNSLAKMIELGIITAEDLASLTSNSGILRGDIVAISYLSLFAFPKNGTSTLLEKLHLEDGAISAAQLKSVVQVDKKITMLANTLGIPSPRPASAVLDSEEIFAAASQAVFKIELKAFEDEDAGSGSGFFISSDGIAVTNFHVLVDADSASITTADGKMYPIEGVLGVAPKEDLALIKIKGSGFPYLTLGDPAELRTAQRIYCIGSPYGLDNSISDGLVSSVNREFEGNRYIQISAPIAPGSSGGALLNEYGQVVGVTTASIGEGNVNLAVPVTKLGTLFRFDEARSLRYFQVHARFEGVIPYGRDQIELEPNDDAAKQGLKNGDVLSGSISSTDDVDYYYVDIDEISALLVSLTSTAKNSGMLKFEVIDAVSEDTLFQSQHYSGEIFSCAIGDTPEPGRYVIKVYAAAGTEITSELKYDLFCFWYMIENEEYFYYSDLVEFEPNNTPEMANFMPNFGSVFGSVHSPSDVDYLNFNVHKLQLCVIVVGVLDDNAENYLICEVIDAKTNSVVGRLSYDPQYEVFELTKEFVAGQYYLKIAAKSGSSFDSCFYYTLFTAE